MDSDQFIRPYRILSILLLAQRYVKETNSTIINDILSQISFPEKFFGANSQSTHRAKGLDFTIKNPIRCLFFNPSLRRFRASVSPLYFASQNTGEKVKYNPSHSLKQCDRKSLKSFPYHAPQHYGVFLCNIGKTNKHDTPKGITLFLCSS